MNMKRKSLIAIISIIGIILLFKLFTPTPTTSQENCKNPTKLEDYTDRDKRLLICEDSVTYGDVMVTNKNNTPGIFEYKFNDQDPWEPTHEVIVYSIDKDEFIAIFPVINPQSWYRRSGYIFQKTEDSYKLIFDRDFESLSGRWTGVRFDENGSVFDSNVLVVNQDLGALGPEGQRIRWTDYYQWDSNKNSYILANDKMGFRMKELIKSYDELDLVACGNESQDLVGKRISELYQTRSQNDHFCIDNSPVPYISNKQATLFLKAKKALDANSKGDNKSYNDIESINLQ